MQISSAEAVVTLTSSGNSLLQGLLRFTRNKPLGAIMGIIIVLVVLMSVFADVISPYHPLDTNPIMAREPPDREHWMGYDEVGRDVLSRVIFGSRISLIVGITSVVFGTVLGSVWGLASGYLGGKFDLITQRAVEVWMSFPSLVLALSLLVVLGAGLHTVIIAVAFTRVPYGVRVIRSVSIAVKEFMYVDAARSIGASEMRVMLRHVLPNCVAPFLIIMTAHIGTAIIVEASLGFLGIGIPPPTASWGQHAGQRGGTGDQSPLVAHRVSGRGNCDYRAQLQHIR
ncbi:Glutathione transport system permease protein GsiD [Geodia barretti]|uniref:Glutathione transport system permease protein GsiD n=1 Tax=Geodia barretti TaxID=519541 RepID=A0AA35U1N7_GEOBA|nr:Glutathione transport system permease protein GsiD [Geodia barretti]